MLKTRSAIVLPPTCWENGPMGVVAIALFARVVIRQPGAVTDRIC